MLIDSWYWIPGISVGPFHFGADASDLIDRFGLIKLESDIPSADWVSYDIPGCESGITTEDNKISSVTCYDHLFYKNIDLLRLNMDEVREILGPEENMEPHLFIEGIQVACYNRLGLMLFIEDERIKSAACNEIVIE